MLRLVISDIGIQAGRIPRHYGHFLAVNGGGGTGAGKIDPREDNGNKQQSFFAHVVKFALKVIN